jgi:recombination protein U
MSARGHQLELAVEKQNSHYLRDGIARIDKVATPMIYSNGEWKHGKKSTVDFIGCLKGGRAVAFDCKQVAGDSLPMANIHEHQVKYLRDVLELGGLAFFLVHFRKQDRVFRFSPNDCWATMHYGDRKAMGLTDFYYDYAGCEIPVGVPFDYLKGAY